MENNILELTNKKSINLDKNMELEISQNLVDFKKILSNVASSGADYVIKSLDCSSDIKSTLNDAKNLLTGRIPLPFKSKCGYDNLSVICTLDAFDETLQSSVLTTKIDFSESIIKEFEVNLRNVLGEYSRRFYVEDSFEKSFISVSIKGKYVD